MTDGFHLVVEALKLNGVDTIYGVAGIPITDLLRLAQAEGIRYFGFRHEQSAGNAAAIAGFLTQKPGICMTVSAPGFLNGMVALANATTNCFPMIMISGSSDRAIVDLEQGDYEEMDQLERRQALCQGGLPHQPAAGHRHRHCAGDPRRLLGAPGRRLSRPDGRGARLGARRGDGEEVAGRRSSIRRRRSPRRRNRSRAPSNCWRMPSARS